MQQPPYPPPQPNWQPQQPGTYQQPPWQTPTMANAPIPSYPPTPPGKPKKQQKKWSEYSRGVRIATIISMIIGGLLLCSCCGSLLFTMAHPNATASVPPTTAPSHQVAKVIKTPTHVPTKKPTVTPTQRPTPTATPVPTEPPTPTAQPTVYTQPTATSVPTQAPQPTPTPTTAPSTGVNGNPWGYNFIPGNLIYSPNSAFCSAGYFTCVSTFWVDTRGYVVECGNGEYSHSGGISGACSRDSGVEATLYSH